MYCCREASVPQIVSYNRASCFTLTTGAKLSIKLEILSEINVGYNNNRPNVTRAMQKRPDRP